MQRVYYIDNHFVREHASAYTLSIRYATDGLSFCVHGRNLRLLAFCHRPYQAEEGEAQCLAEEVMREEELLRLRYGRVCFVCCTKGKMLVPAALFDKGRVAEMYRLCLPAEGHDTLLYRRLAGTESYLVEALPRSLVGFLTARHPGAAIVNSAYPFVVQALESMVFNAPHVFIDLHDRYFDLLAVREGEVALFNSFDYGNGHDVVYHVLNSMDQCGMGEGEAQAVVSGDRLNDAALRETLERYIPRLAEQPCTPLSQLVGCPELNDSTFIHLLNIHKCV